MIFINFNKIARLRPGAIDLQSWQKPGEKKRGEPNPSADILRTIVNIARYHKIRTIPENTVERLRTDPDFKYAFSICICYCSIYKTDDYGKEQADKIKKAIRNPSSVTAREIVQGMIYYINNFIGYLPGGSWRQKHFGQGLILRPKQQAIIEKVDLLLQEENRAEKLKLLAEAAAREDEPIPFTSPKVIASRKDDRLSVLNVRYAKRLEYLRFCVSLFDAMIDKYGYTPEELW
jgi:hypothetical protein